MTPLLSVSGAAWALPRHDEDAIATLMRATALPEAVARLLAARGVAAAEVDAFLNPRLKDHFPDPATMAGMNEAAAIIADTIEQGGRIGVFGDFDVDGATSTALAVRYLRACGMDAPFYIPDRTAEGYGPNMPGLRQLKEQGCALVLILDCGITAHNVLAQAQNEGIDTIVIDHHEPDGALPPVRAVVNPKRADDASGLAMLAAVGVTFMTMVAVNRVLKERGFFAGRGLAEPALKDFLDLVALGTVCDMVPLTGINRLLVKTGMMRLKSRVNPGIHALAEISRIEGDITLTHLGFALGPRINAGSRVHQARLGAEMLATDDAGAALEIARVLDVCNSKRKDIENEMIQGALRMVEARGLANDPVIILDDPSWHPGLVGLVAGRLKDRFDRPVCMIAYAAADNGGLEGRGSARSVPGVNIAACFQDAFAAGLVIKGGGHAMAGGFTIAQEQLPAFREFMRAHVEQQRSVGPARTEKTIDAVITARGITVEAAMLLEDNLGPFGVGNAEPVFLITGAVVQKMDWLGSGAHARLMVGDANGGGRVKAMAFRAQGGPVGDALSALPYGESVDLVGKIKVDEWQGRKQVSFFVDDVIARTAAAARLRA